MENEARVAGMKRILEQQSFGKIWLLKSSLWRRCRDWSEVEDRESCFWTTGAVEQLNTSGWTQGMFLERKSVILVCIGYGD